MLRKPWPHISEIDSEKNLYLYSGKELQEQGGLNGYDHGARFYDPVIGRWNVIDPASQVANPYLAMGNNPLIYVDPDGRFWHIVIGAVVGGVANTITHWDEVAKGGFWEGVKAFGVGAVAGGLGAATGGAAAGALGLSATSVAGGVAMGSVGAVYNDMALGVGNMVAFGEWYEPSLKRTGTTALLGGLTGGAVVGGSNLIRGANFWTGIKATSSVSHMVQKGVVNQQGELISNSGKVYVNGGAKGGESIWTSTKKLKSVENAFAHFKKHGAEFSEFSNAKQYVEGAKNFLHNSPTGTLMKTRANGDILKYHPGTNTFGVMDASGVPRTMFKPGDGMQYWLKQ